VEPNLNRSSKSTHACLQKEIYICVNFGRFFLFEQPRKTENGHAIRNLECLFFFTLGSLKTIARELSRYYTGWEYKRSNGTRVALN
jgi:hypothetical protein